MSALTSIASYFGIGLAGGLALTPLCRVLAHRFGYVAKPLQDRWHKRPTALFGGIAIVVPTLILGATVSPTPGLWQLLACVAFIAAVGFVDDVRSLKPSTKLIAQIVVASALLFFGYRLHWTESMVFDSMLTLFWIVGITNAMNLLDNMDGLCAGTSIIAGVFLLTGTVTSSGFTPTSLYLAGLLGATGGFLVFNYYPAKIFMGDTGSLFLGLNLAAVTLLTQKTTDASGVISVVAGPVLLLLLPIFDTTLVTVMRLLSGRRPSQGGRDHSSHRLAALGLHERRAVITLWSLAASAGAIGLLMKQYDWAWILAVGFVLAVIIFAVYLSRIRVYADDPTITDTSRLTPLIVDIMYKRRIAEVLLDLILIPLAYYMAYRLHFDGIDDKGNAILAVNFRYFIQSLPVVLPAQIVALLAVGGYQGSWQYFGIMDAYAFARGVVAGTAASVFILVYAFHFESYSRAVFIIYAIVLFLLLVGSRASFRMLSEFTHRQRRSGQRCVIYGTSGASVAIIREAFQTQPMKILGFIDDDPMQANVRVAGYAVLGDFLRLMTMIERDDVDCVVVNARVGDAARLQKLEAACRQRDVDLVTLQLNLKPFTIAS